MQVREKGVCSDLNQTAKLLQMKVSKSLQAMSGMILNRSQPKFAAKLVANASEKRCWKSCRDLHWLDELRLLIWGFDRNLPLKIFIYWITDQPYETHLEDLSNFQALSYHYSAAQWALSKKCAIWNNSTPLYVQCDFMYQLKVCCVVWPWHSARAIQQW